jgi:hypothetical protein
MGRRVGELGNRRDRRRRYRWLCSARLRGVFRYESSPTRRVASSPSPRPIRTGRRVWRSSVAVALVGLARRSAGASSRSGDDPRSLPAQSCSESGLASRSLRETRASAATGPRRGTGTTLPEHQQASPCRCSADTLVVIPSGSGPSQGEQRSTGPGRLGLSSRIGFVWFRCHNLGAVAN